MEWAKTRPSPRFDLAGSNVLGCSVDDLEGAREALALSGKNDTGYAPLLEAIASRYGVRPGQVTTAQGTSGANFLACAALVEPGDDVLVEAPGYDPLLGAPRLLGANIVRFDRRFDDGWALDPARVERALTPRTRLVIITRPHNPTGALEDPAALREIGRLAAGRGAHVLVDEVYLDAADAAATPAATFGDEFISTSSLTKSYGLSGLRSGWILSSEEVAHRVRRARDVVDGTGSIVAERLSVLAFEQLEKLIERSRAILAANGALLRSFPSIAPGARIRRTCRRHGRLSEDPWRRELRSFRRAVDERSGDRDRPRTILRRSGSLPDRVQWRCRTTPRWPRSHRRSARRAGVELIGACMHRSTSAPPSVLTLRRRGRRGRRAGYVSN